jgi:NMD protein affecting ribosome stability and mRNA decay
MEDELRSDGAVFPVVCVWCGEEIRRASAPEPQGMCQRCFQHMVEEHTRLAARQRASVYASER